jgi:hypothetical protein
MLSSKIHINHTMIVTSSPNAVNTMSNSTLAIRICKIMQRWMHQPAKAYRARLNMGLRGEHSLSASLSGTSKSSLPFNDDRLLLLGVIGGGELAATTTSASIAAQAESSISGLSQTGSAISGRIDSGEAFEVWSSGDGEGAHASVFLLRRGDFATRGVRDQSGGGGL